MLGFAQLFAPSNGCTKYWYAVDQFLSPTLLALVAGIVALFLFSFLYYRKSSKIKVFRTLSHLPSGKGMIQAYLTAYYAREWGNLIGQGLELSQIFTMMQKQNPSFSKRLEET